MNKLGFYVKGFLIGIIAEYIFRVEFGYLPASILLALIIEMLINVIIDWDDSVG